MASMPTGFDSHQEMSASVDQRGAERFTPMMRTAKLVARRGEMLCVVRDISDTGVAVKLFHPLPDQKALALEMADGTRHGLLPVWQSGERAGFRFAGEVDLAELIAGVGNMPRRPLRLNIRFGVELVDCQGKHMAEIRNISQQGASVVTSYRLSIDQRLRVQAETLPELEANVRWRHEDTYGLVFDDVLTFAQLARLAAQVQAFPLEFR
ncbi:PilZ domain-containing protein [Paraurantiacibacter namhicola]|nr:PilZ domain-containing protein [Paraurantiacibacter namhicola]